MMKVALVHDFLVEYGGAERVLETLHEIWPEAPIYTAFYDKNGPGMEKFSSLDIRTAWLQKLPFARCLLSPFRLFSLMIFESFDLTPFDLVISSTWMYMAKGVLTRPESLHFCYMHTPPRFLYGYKTAREWQQYWWGRWLGGLLNHKMRMIDFLATQRPDYLIANSHFTARRIWKFYRRKATVIYPPVELYQPQTPPRCADALLGGEITDRNYFLCVSRLARAKRVDLAIKACNQLQLPLWIVGTGREATSLRAMAGKTIKFLGFVSDERLAQIYAGCRALIFPAEEEDFGIALVEASSFGKPVIALRSGGTVESVEEGKTGLFFDEPSLESLITTLKKFTTSNFRSSDCRTQAKKFSKEKFKREIKKFVGEKWQKRQ